MALVCDGEILWILDLKKDMILVCMISLPMNLEIWVCRE